MPLLTTLVDNFNDAVIGPNWGDSYGGVTETGGKARVPVVAGTYAGYQTGRAWTFAGASVYLKLATLPAASTGTEVHANFSVTSAVNGTSVGWMYKAVTSVLRMQSNVDYYDPTGVEIPYDPVNHLWLRLREDGTNVYWDTSSDGTTWTNRRTLATPAWIPAAIDTCALDLFAYRDAGTSDYAEYDNVNTLNDGAVHTAGAALTVQSGLVAAVKATAVTGAALTAQENLTAAPTVSAHTAAALSGQARLTAATDDSTVPEEVVSLAAGDWDLRIEQGATFVQSFTCSFEDPTFTWDGWTARSQCRTSAGPTGELLLDLTGYLTVNGAVITLTIPAAITTTLDRSGRWDLEMVKGSYVVRLLQGAVSISLEVTR